MAEILNNWIKIILKYSIHNWLYTVVGGYFILSILLFSYFDINIGIPCLFRLATGLKCPGCGLTHAFAHIIKFQFAEAWADNKLSFIVLPAGVFFIIKDFISFRKKLLYVTE
jgi:hypothetical protein